MTTAIKTPPDSYMALVAEFRLRPLRSDAELDGAIAIIDRLMGRDLDHGERDYLDALSAFVEVYESEHYPIPDVSPVEILRHLIEDGGRSQAAVAAGAGVSESTISDILAGRRAISAKARRAFAEFFGVDPSLFI